MEGRRTGAVFLLLAAVMVVLVRYATVERELEKRNRARCQKSWSEAADAYGELLEIIARQGEPYWWAAVECRMGQTMAWMQA